MKLKQQHGLILLGLILLPISLFTFKLGKKIITLKNKIEKFDDTLPPILFLRSFKDDSDKYPIQRLWNIIGLLILGPYSINLKTEEEEIKLAVDEFGPFIALGSPKEILPKLGASRFYSPNETWKETIIKLIKISKFIIIKIGETDNLWWEIKTTLTIKEKNKVFFLLPQNKKAYHTFQKEWESTFQNIKLPEFDSSTDTKFRGLFIINNNNEAIFHWNKPTFWGGGVRRLRIASKLKHFLLNYHPNLNFTDVKFSDRIKSLLIDFIILLTLIIFLLLFQYLKLDSFFFFFLAITLLIHPLSDLIFHRTIGKIIFNLIILDENRVQASNFQIFLRCYFKYSITLISIILVIPMVVFLYFIFSRKIFYYDILSKTKVFYKVI